MLSWLEIDLGAIRDNLRVIRDRISDSQIMAIIKSNAYGHGLVPVAEFLQSQKIGWFGVTSFEEAIELQEAGLPAQAGIDANILILSYVEPKNLEKAVNNDFRLTVYDRQQISYLEVVAKNTGKKPKIHLKIETGLNRLGLSIEEATKIIKNLPWVITLEGVMTHLAASDEDNGYTKSQLKQFDQFMQSLGAGAPKVIRHAANSGAIFNPDVKVGALDMVRPGIALFGYLATSAQKDLKPALTWKARIISIKNVKKGETVGYGRIHKMARDGKVAVVSVGYAEGYDRGLSNKAHMLVSGVKCPVIGRVAMSMTIIDVSAVSAEELEIGKEVVVIGKSGKEEVTALELAKLIDTNVHEIFTRIPAQVQRIYKN